MQVDAEAGRAVTAAIPILIVAYRNARDVDRCLQALAQLDPEPGFAVYVCENGGTAAFETLLATLTGPAGACNREYEAAIPAARFVRSMRLCLPSPTRPAGIPVLIAEAKENFGYAGGINAWLEPLLAAADTHWPGVWILNPDTEPEPGALRELVAEVARSGRAMIGSRLVERGRPEIAVACGLAWRRWRGATRIISGSDPETIQRDIDSPSGASLYVTRECLDRIGLMDESYFLYFEDLDWGLSAKSNGGVGYANQSIVVHEFGTTIGSATSRRRHSPLSVYLDFRNRLLFVKRNFPGWEAWTALMEALEVAEYARLLAFGNAWAALQGVVAGLLGREGRPDHMLRNHRPPAALPLRPPEGRMKRSLKLVISLVFYGLRRVVGVLARFVGAETQPKLRIFCYHTVKPGQEPAFSRQMQALKRWAHIVPADWRGDHPGDPSQPLVAITFDDAFESILSSAVPVMRGLDLPCTIFVPCGYLGGLPGWRMETDADRSEQVMTGTKIAEVAQQQIAIGSHTVTHPHLTAVSSEVARHELVESRQQLEAITGRPVRLFAFPYGDYNEACVELCRECGYTFAFTIEPREVVPAAGAIARGRISVSPSDWPLEFFLKASGGYAWMAQAGSLKRALFRPFSARRQPWYLAPESRG